VSRRTFSLALAAVLALAGASAAGADEIELDVEIPSLADEPFEVTDAQLRWGLNEEAGSGAFAGGCNFLSAGAVGDTGGSKVWTAQDGHFSTRDGAVTIEKPVAMSQGVRFRPVSFADRCKDADGREVSASSPRGTGIQAVIDGGTGRVDPASGDATIAWEGSVTVVFYGGMTYWWFTDPVLEVRDGRGTLTATASGYGTSRDDMSAWDRLPGTKIVLADLPEVSLRGDKGFAAQPAYLGVEIDVPSGAPAQRRTGENWGSFPQSFVDFQEGTGQQAFWYSSGGVRDVAKPATPLTVSYDAADPTPSDPDPDARPKPDPDEDGGGDEAEPKNPVRPRPAPRPGVTAPPAPAAGTSAAEALALPSAVPAVTVLPVETAPAASSEAALADTGVNRAPAVLALAGILLGSALTVVGYRSRWLVWPGSGPRKGQS